MPPDTLYPTKHLRYKICEFFLERRRGEPGLGAPLQINLQDMTDLLEFATGDDRVAALRHELSALNEERFGELLDRPVISIANLPAPENFPEALRTNEPLEIRCLSENLEDYISELKTRTQVARRHLGLVELETLPSGGVKIVLGDRAMKVTKSKINNLDLYIRIVKLMYGEPVNIYGENISLENYERKNFITFDELQHAITRIVGEDFDEEDDQLKIQKLQKAIKDAAAYLNNKSVEVFECPLFEIKNEGLNWIL